MKKKNIIIIILVSILVIILLGIGIVLYNNHKIKNAKIDITLEEKLEVPFLADAKVSDFITHINGKIEDDYVIDTTKVGKKKIEFSFINDDGIKLSSDFTINIVDQTEPLVWLNNTFTVTKGQKPTIFERILCGDDYDTNPKCEVVGDYDLDTVGEYPLEYHAEDSSGNKAVHEFTLNVIEPKNSSGPTTPKETTAFSDVVNAYKTEDTQIGIDVSKWQGDIDFAKLKEAGVEFIMIRVGSADGIDGEYFVDSKFERNIKGANEANIPVGVYYYSYANTKKRAIEDAKWVLKQIKGYKVDLPVAFDWENWNDFNEFHVSFYGLSQMATGFLDTLNKEGYDGLLYSSKTYLERIWMPISYPTWLAHYTKSTNYKGEYDYWQLCNNGRVDGILGDVDIDIRYLKKAN